METTRTFQIHANVNSDHGDSALRVTITFYDETGASVGHETWRAHTRSLYQADMPWQAYSGCVDLCKMMAQICNNHVDLEPVDSPLF